MALQYRTEPEWKTFFTNAGIPETEATSYAQKFVTNRMTERTLPAISKQHLTDIGITVLDDVLSIIQHATTPTANTIQANISTPLVKPPSIKPPSIIAEMTNPQFRKAKIDWDIY